MRSEAPTPEAFVARCREDKGTRWVHQGRLPGVGLDCTGMANVAAEEVGLPHHAGPIDYELVNARGLLDVLRDILVEVDATAIRPADIVVFRNEFGPPTHIAVVADYPGRPDLLSIIHAATNRGEVVEHRLTLPMRRDIVAAFRFPQFVD